ncbi:MAG: MCP four helix bundle domain-containing protein, partial [Terriglobales bacterium]
MRLTLGKKLGMGFGVILALMVFSTFMAYIKSADIRQSEDITFEVRIPQAKVARELEGDLNQTQSKARHVILSGTDPVRWQGAKKTFDENWRAVE